MTRQLTLPPSLQDRPFTRRQAIAAGVPEHLLHSSRFVQPIKGTYASADLEVTRYMLIHAALLLLPEEAATSHHTGLEVLGTAVGPAWPLHFSTNSTSQCRRDGIILHRRQGRLHPIVHNDLPTLQADRCFVDSATTLRFVASITAGDQLVHLGHTNPGRLAAYADSVHLDGVVRARLRATYVRKRVESPRETRVRLMLVFARLPTPETNLWVGDTTQRIARSDLVYRAYRVIVEYDGRFNSSWSGWFE